MTKHTLAWDRTRLDLPDAQACADGWRLASSIADPEPRTGADADAWAELDRMRAEAHARYKAAEAAARAHGELPPLSALRGVMDVDTIWLRRHPGLKDEYLRRGHDAARDEDQDPDF